MTNARTTIAEFSHPDADGTVTLVGNRHYGSHEYLHTIRSTMLGFDAAGAKVHYESVGRSLDYEIDSLPSDLRYKYIALDGLMALVRRHHVERGCETITDVLTDTDGNYPVGWERHDVSFVDIAQRTRGQQGLALKAFGLLMDTNDKVEGVINKFGKRAVEKMIISLVPLIVDHRNSVALEAVDEAVENDPSQNLVLLWGEGHIPGLATGLNDRGYQRESTRFIELGQ